MNFRKKLETAWKDSGGYVCVGLDPELAKMPSKLSKKTVENVYFFLHSIIEATQEFAAAYKLNLAFFEALGDIGWLALRETVNNIPDNRIIIADGKRGDIGNSAKFYAQSLFDDLGVDAATVNPYMGKDAVEPFIVRQDKGCFILALTSNPGAFDFQLFGSKQKLFETVAAKAVEWNQYNNIGLVTGATRPEYFGSLRQIAPDLPFLIPGIGAQGGDLKSSIDNGLKGFSGKGLINSSRDIIYASAKDDFAEAARAAVRKLRDAINSHLD